MNLFTDQTGEKLELINIPKRVISLVPSITEMLIDMGINVVGRTKFCFHPLEKVKSIPIIGGTKKFRFETIHQLNPDLIIGNKEENYLQGITELRKKYPVFMTEIYSLSDSLHLMNQIGQIASCESNAHKLMMEVREKHNKIADTKSGSALYFIWKNPWMVAGKNTYIDAILTHLGYQNAINESRYPQLSEASIKELNPDHVLVSSEPYPFKENDLNEIKLFFPNSQIKAVNGEPYSWYGTRLLKCDF
jgi:ABC-type Fe3+-hydroxamate transport system substrate-binding protein